MLNQQTIEKLYTMRMRGMRNARNRGRRLHPATGRSPNHATQLRGTIRAAGGPPVELAAGPGLGEAPQRGPSARSSLHRRYRLPCDARPGQAGGPSADPRLGLDPTPSTYFPGGPDRDRKNVPGASLRTEGMPRWLHCLLRHCLTVVPGTRTGSGRRQLR
jgi:hypothetical protein